MKKNTLYIGVATALMVLSACDDLKPEDVNFNVTAEQTTVKVGEPAVFYFDGNPNFITVYTGEEGHKYEYRNRVELEQEDIVSASLSFTLNSQYGTQKDAIRVLLGKDFPGLTQKDTIADGNTIREYAWDDITQACGIQDGKKVNAAFDLTDYLGGMTLAFHFTGQTGSTQRTITVNNLIIKTVLQNGSSVETKAEGLNFLAYDMIPSNPEKNAYKMITSGTKIKGTWLLNDIASNQFQMQGGTPTALDNDDWLISTPMKLNACTPDVGEVVKDINRRVEKYEHVFNAPGTYTVTFLAGNTNVEGKKEVVKQLTIEVQDKAPHTMSATQ